MTDDDGMMSQALTALGVGQLALGVWQAATPGSFYRILGPFGAANAHYVRDVSTLYLALGAALLIAARRSSWRIPILFFAAVQYGLHTVNHLIDIGEADPGWIGPLDVVLLGATAAALGVLLWRAREERVPG
jgi:Na+-transporting NADH:ubiquinone oxidoreductase subunit NqrB